MSWIKSDVRSFIEFCRRNILMLISSVFFIVLAYGIKLSNCSISIDTEIMINSYDGTLRHWLTIGRFGLDITKKLFGLNPFNPYVACFLMICAMFLCCLTWAYLLSYLGNDLKGKSVISCIFPIVFITSPLFSEQFNFILQGFEVALGLSFCSISLFLISKWILEHKSIFYAIFGTVFMVWGFSSYQAIVFLYISAMIACYMMIYVNNQKQESGFNSRAFKVIGLKYLATCIIGYLAYVFIDKAIRYVCKFQETLDGHIMWGKLSNRDCIKNIFRYMKKVFLGDGLFYSKMFSVAVVIILAYALINLFLKSQDKIIFVLITLALVFSPFLGSIYLGNEAFVRSQFGVPFVIAFGIYFLAWVNKDNKWKLGCLFIALIIAFGKANLIATLLYKEDMKYRSEVTLANKISMRIESLNLGAIPESPVVFVGHQYPINTPIEIDGTEIIGKTFFEQDAGTPTGSNYRILGFMKTIGYPYVNPSMDQLNQGKEIAKNMGVWPNADSVKLVDDIIVVKLSN